jgi:hypothetical protein
MSKTPFIIVCPDTYEFIYPSMLYPYMDEQSASVLTRDIDTAIRGCFELPFRALALLTSSRDASDEKGGPMPLETTTETVVGRWFNKRIAVVTQGKLFNKLRDLAEGQLAEAKLAALAPAEASTEDFLIDSILDGISLEQIGEEMDDEDPDAPEPTDADKEEFVPTDPTYTNVTATVRTYLDRIKVGTGGAVGGGATTPPAKEAKPMKTKANGDKAVATEDVDIDALTAAVVEATEAVS